MHAVTTHADRVRRQARDRGRRRRGIGHAIAVAFAENGAEVIACDRLADEVEKFAGPVEGGGTSAPPRSTSPTRPPSPAVVADGRRRRSTCWSTSRAASAGRAEAARGRLGRGFPPDRRCQPHRRVLFAQAVAPGMKRAGRGRIVTISSRAALAPSLTGIQAYASAKHGQLGLVRQLAHELGPFGITVNTIAPGFLRTSPDYEPQWDGWGAEGQKQFVDASPCAAWAPRKTSPMLSCFSPPTSFLDHRTDLARDGIARRPADPDKSGGVPHERTKAARALAVAGGALAPAGQPGARRTPSRPKALEGRRALRLRDLVRFRSRDQRAARRRQIDRPHGLGPVRQPRRRTAHPEDAEAAT